jgi:hypothetical protein
MSRGTQVRPRPPAVLPLVPCPHREACGRRGRANSLAHLASHPFVGWEKQGVDTDSSPAKAAARLQDLPRSQPLNGPEDHLWHRTLGSAGAGLLWAPHANAGVSHDCESTREVCSAIGEHLNGNRNPPLSRKSGQAQEHDTWVRLLASEHKLAKVAQRSRQPGIALRRQQDRPHRGGGHRRRT